MTRLDSDDNGPEAPTCGICGVESELGDHLPCIATASASQLQSAAEPSGFPSNRQCPDALCRGDGWLFAPNMTGKLKPCLCRLSGRFDTEIQEATE